MKVPEPRPETNRGSQNLLRVSGLSAGYLGNTVVSDIDLNVNWGEVVGLVGRNGSGKSTVLLGISGLIRSSADSILLLDKEIGRLPPHQRSLAGLKILLQKEGIFTNLSISDNLSLSGMGRDCLGEIKHSPVALGVARSIVQRHRTRVASLSGGEQRLLSFIMTYGTKAQVLLCDEPTLGLSAEIENEVFGLLRGRVDRDKTGALLVAHNLELIERTCDRVYVIEQGNISHELATRPAAGELQQILKE